MTHCSHFPACGGCAVDTRNAIAKPALLQSALTRAGFMDTPLHPLVDIALQSRRRADFGVLREGAGISLGLHAAKSRALVDMRECALLDPAILGLLPPLRALLRGLGALRREGAVQVNLLDHGADILLRADGDFALPDRNKIIAFAKAQNCCRISIAKGAEAAEPVAILMPPVISFAGVKVEAPPGAFLQASAPGEAAILAAILAGLPKFKGRARIVELFAGIGTFSFTLAQQAQLNAYEGDAAAAAALDKAARAHDLGGKLNALSRDLHRKPLQPREFLGAAAVVLDPPFAGAGAQMRFLAAAKIPRVIYVSCNPEALAHDGAILRHAGYGCVSATPIDQFPFSRNLESVVVFEAGSR